MFIENDEHIIIMEDNFRHMSIVDFQKLEDCGIKTVYLHKGLYLQSIFKSPTKRDWSVLHSRIDRILENTKLKILLPFFVDPPKYLKDLWFQGGFLDYITPEAGRSIDDITLEVLDETYFYTKNRMQLIYAYDQDGEFPWRVDIKTITPPLNDAVANYIVERQEILSTQYGEVWTTFHNTCGGNWELIKAINKALYDAFPDHAHYRIQYSHFPMLWADIQEKSVATGKAKFFVGSEYVEGLKANMPLAIAHKVWGFLTSPVHQYTTHLFVEDWMLEVIRNANKTMQEIWK